MTRKTLAFGFALGLLAGGLALPVTADGNEPDVARHAVAAHALPNVPGHRLTAVTIELGPGVAVPAHTHDAVVWAYVLEGVVRSQLGDDEPKDFETGQSWIEPPGVVHSLTQNLSSVEPAKILAVFVAKDGAQLTTSGELPEELQD